MAERARRAAHRLIRREALDHLIVFGEAHLRHILRAYASYYNGVRTHLSLDKDAPAFRHQISVKRQRGSDSGHCRVTCPWHGYRFDLATGACVKTAKLSVAIFPVRVEGDTVLVDA